MLRLLSLRDAIFLPLIFSFFHFLIDDFEKLFFCFPQLLMLLFRIFLFFFFFNSCLVRGVLGGYEKLCDDGNVVSSQSQLYPKVLKKFGMRDLKIKETNGNVGIWFELARN